MLENAFYSVISPEGCAAILWRTAEAGADAARALRLTAADLVELGVVDQVVPEPPNGAQTDGRTAAGHLRRAIDAALSELSTLELPTLLAARYERLRSAGVASAFPSMEVPSP